MKPTFKNWDAAIDWLKLAGARKKWCSSPTRWKLWIGVNGTWSTNNAIWMVITPITNAEIRTCIILPLHIIQYIYIYTLYIIINQILHTITSPFSSVHDRKSLAPSAPGEPPRGFAARHPHRMDERYGGSPVDLGNHLVAMKFMNIWLVVSNMNCMFHNIWYIWDVILPIDELIFFRGIETTNQYNLC